MDTETPILAICPEPDCERPMAVIQSVAQPLGWWHDEDGIARITTGDHLKTYAVTCGQHHPAEHRLADGEELTEVLLRQWLIAAGCEIPSA